MNAPHPAHGQSVIKDFKWKFSRRKRHFGHFIALLENFIYPLNYPVSTETFLEILFFLCYCCCYCTSV